MKTILKIKWENIFLTITIFLILGIMALFSHKHTILSYIGFESIIYFFSPIFLKEWLKEMRKEALKRC